MDHGRGNSMARIYVEHTIPVFAQRPQQEHC